MLEQTLGDMDEMQTVLGKYKEENQSLGSHLEREQCLTTELRLELDEYQDANDGYAASQADDAASQASIAMIDNLILRVKQSRKDFYDMASSRTLTADRSGTQYYNVGTPRSKQTPAPQGSQGP